MLKKCHSRMFLSGIHGSPIKDFGDDLILSRHNQVGFTYIEMLVVIALVALCFVPLLQMFARSMEEVAAYSHFGTAIELGREGMESMKNLRFTEAQLEKLGVEWIPPEDKPPLSLNGGLWRVRKTAVRGTDPLEIRVDVFQAEDLMKPVVQLATLIEDL